MSYRSPICAHCRMEPAVSECLACGLWICQACLARGCNQSREAWTGLCRGCNQPYPDEQRRDVLDDGDGEVVCAHCGSTHRLRQLTRLEDREVAVALVEQLEPCPCGRSCDPGEAQGLFVLHDRWFGRRGKQTLYYLLCACGRTLASTAGAG